MSEPYRGHCDYCPPNGLVHVLEAGVFFILLYDKDNRSKHKSRDKEEKEEKSELHVNCLKKQGVYKKTDEKIEIDLSFDLNNKVYLKTRSRLINWFAFITTLRASKELSISTLIFSFSCLKEALRFATW